MGKPITLIVIIQIRMGIQLKNIEGLIFFAKSFDDGIGDGMIAAEGQYAGIT